ncbi:hypothetical protein CUMW_225970 [Citrus unshiu]|nr:hypothetical protein CUMW_225970 [Citrus unshiu]
MEKRVLVFYLVWTIVLVALPMISANAEVDALYIFKSKLQDPTNSLQSWDNLPGNLCTWFHVTCNPEGSVTRV